MKEVFSAVIPYLKKINWRLDAEAFLSKSAWFIIEENGSPAELVFRKNGALLLVTNGVIQDGQWEVIPELEALCLSIAGTRKLYNASWGSRPILLMEEFGGVGRCILFDREWLETDKKIPVVTHLLQTHPEFLSYGVEYLGFQKGGAITLEDGRNFRSMFKLHANESRPRSLHNYVLIDWNLAPTGLYWSGDRNLVIKVTQGCAQSFYTVCEIVHRSPIGELRIFKDHGGNSLKGGLVAAYENGRRKSVPDGEYKIGWWEKIQVKHSRVI